MSEVTRMSNDKKIKHHGFAHLLLIIALFFLAVVVFGGWTEGPLTSALFLGLKVYGMVGGAAGGDLGAVTAMAPSILVLAVAFIINLIIYYVVATILIFLFNLVFGKG